MKMRYADWGRAFVILLVVWLLLVLLTAFPLFKGNPSESDAIVNQLSKVKADFEKLKQQCKELRNLYAVMNVVGGDSSLKQEQKEILYQDLQDKFKQAENIILDSKKSVEKDSSLDLYNEISPKEDPSLQYELTRRNIANGIKELIFFFNAEIRKLSRQTDDNSHHYTALVNRIIQDGEEQQRLLLADIKYLTEVDGYSAWRIKEESELSDLVQRRLKYLQNPKNCSKARKLVCNLNKGCGFGCQVHHAVYCLIVAYSTERTLLLRSKGWRYHKGGWEDVFLPVSETCTDPSGDSRSMWPGKRFTQVVTLSIIDSLNPRPPHMPLAVPKDLAPRLTRIHGDPSVWWIGQFVKYLLRPQPETEKLLQHAEEKLGFKQPIVGIHVRRTDKVGTEAAFHAIEEYMKVADDYFSELEIKEKVDKRRVYVASDDPRVITDAQKKYPNYQVIGDPDVALTASVSNRYSDESLKGIIIDIHLLSKSNFLVCTFSSQVCRLAYEIMQSYFPDAADRFRSLDDIYYFGGQSPHNRIAILPHQPKGSGEMDLKVGDLVGVAGNHWDGFSKGRNLRTNQIALYPSYKVREKVEAVDFPTYPEVPLKNPQL